MLSRLAGSLVPTRLMTLILITGPGVRLVKDVLLARVDNFFLEHALFLHRVVVVGHGLWRWQLAHAVRALFQVRLMSALFKVVVRDLLLLYLLGQAWLIDVLGRALSNGV